MKTFTKILLAAGIIGAIGKFEKERAGRKETRS